MLGGSGLSGGWFRGRDEPKNAPVSLHYPYVRPLQLDWQELPTGFRAARSDEARFEVICAACGDIDGPVDYQPAIARALRGPYNSRKAAEKIAKAHEFAIKLQAGRPRGGSTDAMKYIFPIRLRRLPGRGVDTTDADI